MFEIDLFCDFPFGVKAVTSKFYIHKSMIIRQSWKAETAEKKNPNTVLHDWHSVFTNHDPRAYIYVYFVILQTGVI